jgi:pimeloyl-ACP methyl ester carboxylesterase
MSAGPDYVDDPRFSKSFELPADPISGRSRPFRVQFSDYGYRNEADIGQENVFLFFGSLLGSRLVHITKDALAKKHKIRVINPDRPGFGGTDPTAANDTMKIWRGGSNTVDNIVISRVYIFKIEIIPALLRHLRIQYVSIGCHSGGTVFALDLMLHHPEILHPQRPYLAIGAPWILPKHTGSAGLSIIGALPTNVINQTDKLARLINNHVGPVIGVSFGLAYNLIAKFIPLQQDGRESESAESEGADFEERIRPHIIERIYAEGVNGISREAVLFMQKGTTSWGDWGDYDTGVLRFAKNSSSLTKKIKVDVFYAENDSLIGANSGKGPRWFNRCWDATFCGDVFEYQSINVKGADHNGIWDLKWGTMEKVFSRIRNLAENDREIVD